MAGGMRPGTGLGIVLLYAASLLVPAGARAQNPIAVENALAGDRGWRLTRRAGPGQLEAYVSAASVNHGEAITVHARADGSRTLTWKLYRMGWYGGAEGRLVASSTAPVPVGPQPAPAPASGTGLVECAWPATFTLQTGAAWTTGVYLFALTRDDGPQTWAIFVVRDDERKSAAVLQASFTTYQAYNPWGGTSLYKGPAQEVSFDRPYAEGNGSGQYFRYEHEFVKWAEALGYDLVYVTNLDLDRDPALLLGQKLFLSVGHDEYWSRPAREALEAAIASGVNAAFFSANSVYWHVRLEPSRRDPSRPRRTQVCYKGQASRDPLAGTPLVTVQFRDPRLAWPENGLLGVQYTAWILVDGSWVVRNAGHWLYRGTNVAEGDAIPGIVGYETDRTVGNGAAPPGLELLARSPVTTVEGSPDWHEATVHVRPSGAFVFAAGTIQWSWGLAKLGIADARIQGMTANVFQRAGLDPAPGSVPPGVSESPLQSHEGAVDAVSTLAGRAFQGGLVDGPATAARFQRPTAAAVDADGNVYVADTGNHAVRLVRNDAARTVVTIAGDGVAGEGDGPAARLRSPQGIAVAPDGTVYVSDTGNQRIVRLRPAGAGWQLETLAGLSGWNGHVDAQRTAARFTGPAGLALAGGALYVADRQNNAIRRVALDGTTTTIAGGGSGGYLDGSGAAAQLYFPSDLAAAGGALYVLDSGNHLVRKVLLSGEHTVSTVAGDPAGGFADGPVDGARFRFTAGIAALGGDLVLADAGNARVRRISGGEVTTFAGDGALGAADGSGSEARFGVPTGVTPLPDGRWLVVDQGASTLRVLGTGSGEPLPPPPPAGGGGGEGGCSSGGGASALAVLAAGVGLARGRRRVVPGTGRVERPGPGQGSS
jgi:hypothetical protein